MLTKREGLMRREAKNASATVRPALRSKCETIRELLAAANADEVRARYQIGQIVLEVQRSESRYGEGAVDTIAAEVGCDRSTLYRHGKVAAAWSEREIGALLTTSAGLKPLSWWHLVELSRFPKREQRGALTARARRGLSVRELKRLLRGDKERETPASGASIEARLRTLVTVTEKLRARATLGDAEITGALTRETLALVERAAAAQEELAEICARNLERLRVVRAEVMAVVEPKSGVVLRESRELAPKERRSGPMLAGYA